jgi:cellulose synthase (UDP-forming)
VNAPVDLGDAAGGNAVEPGRLSAVLPYLLLLDVALMAWYLIWLLAPAQVGTRWLYDVLLVVEAYNVVQALTFWWTVRPQLHGSRRIWWSTDRRERITPRWFGAPPTVDVLVPTYNEPVEIVELTIGAAQQLDGAHVNVCLLDDGDRREMADLASRQGVGYFTRAGRAGAKAGNLNHALRSLSAPFVAVLDCDQIPVPSFLTATMGYFHEPRLAYVQSPQAYRNRGAGPISAAAASQQDFFYGPVATGRNQSGSMFCCGTNVVFRRAAIDDAGGFPERSLTEDFALSITLHERGWQSEYVEPSLAYGLGPVDMSSYISQQARWAQGCVGEIPRIVFSRLGIRRRISYLLAASTWLAGFTTLVYLALPLIRIFGGMQPLRHGAAWAFLEHFAPYFAASILTMSIASAGHFTFGAYALRATCFWVDVAAFGRCALRRRRRFTVTPKQATTASQVPSLVVPATLLVALVAAIAYELVGQRGPGAMTTVAFALVWVVVLASGIGAALHPRRASSQGEEAQVLTMATTNGKPR